MEIKIKNIPNPGVFLSELEVLRFKSPFQAAKYVKRHKEELAASLVYEKEHPTARTYYGPSCVLKGCFIGKDKRGGIPKLYQLLLTCDGYIHPTFRGGVISCRGFIIDEATTKIRRADTPNRIYQYIARNNVCIFCSTSKRKHIREWISEVHKLERKHKWPLSRTVPISPRTTIIIASKRWAYVWPLTSFYLLGFKKYGMSISDMTDVDGVFNQERAKTDISYTKSYAIHMMMKKGFAIGSRVDAFLRSLPYCDMHGLGYTELIEALRRMYHGRVMNEYARAIKEMHQSGKTE